MNETPIEIKVGRELPFEMILALYNSVGWSTYTTGELGSKLQEAFRNSTYVVTAWNGEKLIGSARCISDDVSIFYLQDILVDPAYQRQGVGRKLLQNCLERFEHVRIKVLLTDDEERPKAFYKMFGYKNTKDLNKTKINAFVQIAGMDLT